MNFIGAIFLLIGWIGLCLVYPIMFPVGLILIGLYFSGK